MPWYGSACLRGDEVAIDLERGRDNEWGGGGRRQSLLAECLARHVKVEAIVTGWHAIRLNERRLNSLSRLQIRCNRDSDEMDEDFDDADWLMRHSVG